MKFLLFFLINAFICNCLHLSSKQINLINNLIKNPKLDVLQRNYINKILYYSYEKWAIKKAIEFKNLHRHKCKNIVLDDLIFSSKIGLYKSIQKYNGNIPLINFSDIYVKSELLKTITNYFSISKIPKKIRIQNKSNYTYNQLKTYKKHLFPILVSYTNYWQFDKYQNSYNLNNIEENDRIKKIWDLINNFDNFTKQIFYLKYDFEFNKIRSNKKISEILNCSEENIRIKIQKIKNNNELIEKLINN